MLVALAAAHRDFRIHDDVESEGDIVGGERLAVMPQHVGPQLDGPGEAVLGDAAVLDRRNLGGEIGDELALRVDLPQCIKHNEFDRSLDAGVDIKQRIEVDRLLRHADDALARRRGLRGIGQQQRRAHPAERWQRESCKQHFAPVHGRPGRRLVIRHITLPQPPTRLKNPTPAPSLRSGRLHLPGQSRASSAPS